MTKNTPPINKKCKKMGRPVKLIDYELVAKLAMIHCTDEEIASALDLSVAKLKHDAKYVEVRNNSRNKGKASLRRWAYSRAESSDRMLEFLLKNYLGMNDKTSVDLTSSDRTMSPPEQTVDLAKLDLETLLKLRGTITGTDSI